MSAVTEGIDAIASTRVVIGGESENSSTHALTGEKVRRTFRYFFCNNHQPILLITFDEEDDLCNAPSSPISSLSCVLSFSGSGAGMDIVVSSVRAYVSALNKMLGFRVPSSDKSSAGKSRESS